MYWTPVEPSGSQIADPFQFLDHGTVIVRRQLHFELSHKEANFYHPLAE